MSDDTFSAADFESVASSSEAVASTPAESSAPVETTAPPEAATTQPAVDAAVSTSTEPTKPAGPIPFDVHKTALDNARSKAVEEWKQKYGWAEQVNQQDLQEAIRIAQLSTRDPIAYAQELINDLQQHPTYGPSCARWPRAALAQARGQQPQAETEPQPDLPIQLEDGRVVHLYSAEQQAKREAFLQKQWMQSVQQELQPLKQTHEHLQAQRAELRQAAGDYPLRHATYQDVQTWPGWIRKRTGKPWPKNWLGRCGQLRRSARSHPRAQCAYRKVVLPTSSGQNGKRCWTPSNSKPMPPR
jgi:hypothetical protein